MDRLLIRISNCLLIVLIILFGQSQLDAQTFSTSSLGYPNLMQGGSDWGDYDNDGDLDLIQTGFLSNDSPSVTFLYRNEGGGNFSRVSSGGIQGISNGDIRWADYDNDGYLDLALSGVFDQYTGTSSNHTPYSQVWHNNHEGGFTLAQEFTGLSYGSVDWADYDGDGDLDLLICGVPNTNSGYPAQTYICKNNGNGSFTQLNVGLSGYAFGCAKWGDYDNDGDPDILATGADNSTASSNNAFSDIYTNNGDGTFSRLNMELPGAYWSWAAWGDYDSDGFLDFALMGVSSSQYIMKVYHNEGGTSFLDVTGNSDLSGYGYGYCTWADLNNDGNQDLVVGGTGGEEILAVYTYDGEDRFSASPTPLYTMWGYGNQFSVADIDGDQRLDISYTSSIYYNTSQETNTVPTTPPTIRTVPYGDAVLLGWDKGNDSQTAASGLTYNLQLTSLSGGNGGISPMSNPGTGWRQIVYSGNEGHLQFKILDDLPDGSYSWRVQSIDAAYSGSAFSQEGTFSIPGHTAFSYIESPDELEVCSGESVTLTVLSRPEGTAWQWYNNGEYLSGQTGPSITVSETGNYSVAVTTDEGVAVSLNTVSVQVGDELGMPVDLRDGSACNGLPITLSASPGSGGTTCRWYGMEGNYIATGTTITVSLNQTTSFQVATYNTTTECQSDLETVTATVFPTPSPPNTTDEYTCGSESVTLTASPSQAGDNLAWYTSATGGTPFNYGNTFVTAPGMSTLTYYVSETEPEHQCVSSSRSVISAVYSPVPAGPTVPSVTRCGSGSVTLTAQPADGANTCRWYSTSSGTTPIATGTTYTTPELENTTDFLVSSYNSIADCESYYLTRTKATILEISGEPIAEDQVAYGNTRVSLVAIPPPGANTCRWYADPGRSQLLATGKQFLTPTLYSTTQYYVSGFDLASDCEGSELTTVTVTIESPPAVTVSPDQTFPIPQNYGEVNADGVNLFTGDVNMVTTLGTIEGVSLSYSLQGMYNSRSVAVQPLCTDNPLGGLGWKLMDYPKIAWDQISNTWYYLDGMRSYKMDTLSAVSDTMILSPGGEHYLWKFTLYNADQPVQDRDWEIITGNGLHYEFKGTPVNGLDGGNPGYLWNLSKMRDAQRTDSLAFTYDPNGVLQKIENAYDASLELSWEGNRLADIIHNGWLTGGTPVPIGKTHLTYTTGFALNPSYSILSSLTRYVNVNEESASTPVFIQDGAATQFTYFSTDNPGALSNVLTPSGAVREFEYKALPINENTFYPVRSMQLYTGDLHAYDMETLESSSPTTYQYKGVRLSEDGYYLWSNLAQLHPGEDLLFAEVDDQYTSFETSTNDPVFRDLSEGSISSTYALNGNKSYFFNSTFTPVYIHSHTFMLTPQQIRQPDSIGETTPGMIWEGARDSIAISFFAYDTHQSMKVDIHLDFVFQDAQGRPISGEEHVENPEMDDDKYGKWVPFSYVYAIPDGAVSFSFSIFGGDAIYNYDFYLDDVSISGAAYTVQGEEEYFFFNGASAETLDHIPDPYLEENPGDSILMTYYTGFEAGQDFDSWLLHKSDCKPKVRENTSSRKIAFNGSQAYRLKACDDDDNSYMYTKTFAIPPGAEKVMVSFRYSNAMIDGMTLSALGIFDDQQGRSSELDLGSSYYVELDYSSFLETYPVPSDAHAFVFVLSVEDEEGGKGVNECFIDDFTVDFIGDPSSTDNPPEPVDLTDPLLIGQLYHARTFDINYTELGAGSTYYVPSELSDGTRFLQVREENNTRRSAAHSGIEQTYSASGLPEMVTSDWISTQSDGSRKRILTRDHYVYASEIYPEFGPDDLRMMTVPALVYSTVSNDSGKTWQITTANATQWKSYTPVTDGGPAPDGIWSPWRNYILTTPISASAMQDVIDHLGDPNFTPPSANWTFNCGTKAVNATGQVTKTKDAGGNYGHTTYSKRTVGTGSQSKQRLPSVISTFYNASDVNAFYYGFEDYENFSGTFTGSTSETYAHTGTASAENSVSLTYSFDPSKTSSQLYVFSGYLVPGTSIYSISVETGEGVQMATRDLDYSSDQLGKWNYFELLFNAPSTSCDLIFSITPSGTNEGSYYDDLRFSPSKATMRTNVYDQFLSRKTALLDNNGGTDRNFFGRTGGLKGTTILDDQPYGITLHYDSRMGADNASVFNPDDPNADYAIGIRGTGKALLNNAPGRSSDIIVSDGSIGLNSTYIAAGGYADVSSSCLPVDRSDFGLSFRLTLSFASQISSTQSFTADLGELGLEFQLQGGSSSTLDLFIKSGGSNYYSYYTTIPVVVSPDGKYSLDCDLICTGDRAMLWVNETFIPILTSYSASQFSQLRFSLSPGSLISFLDVSNLMLFEDAVISAVFSDGAGNTLQEQNVTEEGVIVNETVYDRMARPVLFTKNVSISGALPGFRAGFVTSFDWESGEMTGEMQQAANYASDDTRNGPYMYSRNIYRNSPQTTITSAFKPGYNFASRPQTNWEKATHWAYEHTDEVVTALGYAMDVVDIILEPEMAPVIIAIDVIDLVTTYYMSSDENDERELPITSMYYDQLQNLETIQLPKANLQNDPKEDQHIDLEYDFMNRIDSYASPESGTSRYCWDDQGQLRFSQNDEQASTGTILCFFYDELGRLAAQGYFYGVWETLIASGLANTPTYPTAQDGVVMNAAYVYDGASSPEQGTATVRGRLTGVAKFNADGSSSSESFTYDIIGNITQKTVSFTDSLGYSNSYSVGYTYDLAGNAIRIDYPEFDGNSFSASYTFNKGGQISSIQTSEDSGDLASFSWNPDGTLSSKTLHPNSEQPNLSVSYLYNAPGWLTTIGYGNLETHYYYENGYNIPYSVYSLGRISINYNFLLDWWSELWGESYYNGAISATEYSPNSSTGLTGHEQGFNYDEGGKLSEYYSDLANQWLDWGLDHIPFDNHYDVNGNLTKSNFSYDAEEGQSQVWGLTHHVGFYNKYHYSNSHNRLKYMSYKAFNDLNSGYDGGETDEKDTLNVGYDESGRVNSLDYNDWSSYIKGKGDPTLESVKSHRISYNWNGQTDRIRWYSTSSTGTLSKFQYNSDGLRLWKEVSYGTSVYTRTHYIHGQGTTPLMEVYQDAAGNTARYYIPGPGGTVAWFRNFEGTKASWFVLKDHLGSPLQLINRSNSLIDAAYTFDAWGNLISEASQNPELYNYRFTGQEFDSETLLYNFKARMYDPQLKQFLSPDPGYTDPARPYAYVGNDPVNNVDPSGKVKFLTHALSKATTTEIREAERKFVGYSLRDLALGNASKEIKKPMRSKLGKIELQRRLNSATPEVLSEIEAIRATKKAANTKGKTDWAKFKDVIRPGGKHEMLPVSKIGSVLELGGTVEDIQSFSLPTSKTRFAERVGGSGDSWTGNYAHHGTKEGKAAHNDFYDLAGKTKNITGRKRRFSTVMAEYRLYEGRELKRAKYSLTDESRKLIPERWRMRDSELPDIEGIEWEDDFIEDEILDGVLDDPRYNTDLGYESNPGF